METRLLEPDVLYVSLPPEPQLRPGLALLRERISHEPDMHLVLDLSRVEIIASPSIGSLLLLQKVLSRRSRRLILCGARLATRSIFQVAGLDSSLRFVEDKSEALTVVHDSSEPTAGMRPTNP